MFHTKISRSGFFVTFTSLLLLLPGAAKASQLTVPDSVLLSNERTLTRWAHPRELTLIRWAPYSSARAITKTHFLTSDGFPEVYLVLRSWHNPRNKQRWLQIRIPMRPNGRVGWLRADALGPLYRVHTLLVISKHRLRATLYKHGQRIWQARVGIGKSSTPTPSGRFWIREKFKTSDPTGLYGPMAFGTSDFSVLSDWPGGGIIGIHGTNEPQLIPGRPSHGCIRLKNKSVRQLWPLLPLGTPLLIK